MTPSRSLAGKALPAAAALGLLALAPGAHAGTYNFDGSTAPPSFSQTTPGPTVFPGLTFTGGVILNDSDFDNAATSGANLYATSDFHATMSGKPLPGTIFGSFDTAYSGPLSLDVIDGLGAADFKLTTYDSNFDVVSTETEALGAFQSGPGEVGHFSLTGSDVSFFSVTSDQAKGSKDFAIDTVQTSPVPEASSVVSMGLLLALGLGGVAVARKRKAFASAA